MKMVKSLLLGSAAGVVAMAGAQAADLPVKAKAVEYVKICSLYGKGFYYIPGSDMCLSITGFVRFQTSFTDDGAANATNSGTASQFSPGQGGNLRNAGNPLGFRVRTMLTFDSRAQTAYGTLRAVSTVGYTNDTNSAPGAGFTLYANRGFIQIAGFTLGKATSFFDFYSAPATSYHATVSSDTGDGGWITAAYTAQFGGGASATIALEEPRRGTLENANTGAAFIGTTTGYAPTNAYAGQRAPDIVGNIRWDQPWGSIQVMGALHDLYATYYTAPFAAAQASGNGHPGDTWGWVIGAGARIRIGADVFDSQFAYTNGATKYLTHTQNTSFYHFTSSSIGYGIMTDGVYTNGLGIDQTTGWALNASYDHRWSPALKTSAYGGYMSISYNATATTNLCAIAAAALPLATGTCSPNWKFWYIGSRTQWDVARAFYVGVDVLYQKLQTADGGSTTTATYAPGGGRLTGSYAVSDQEAWSVTFRAHRDIVP